MFARQPHHDRINRRQLETNERQDSQSGRVRWSNGIPIPIPGIRVDSISLARIDRGTPASDGFFGSPPSSLLNNHLLTHTSHTYFLPSLTSVSLVLTS